MFRIFFAIVFLILPLAAFAAPKGEIVMDLRNGTVLHSKNPDDRLHPASLTKMMTLYVTFDAIARGEISLGDTVTISKHAAERPPSRMNLREGQRITIADLIRGTAIQSANDGASALAEAVSGSESAFVDRMNRTAQAMGMTNTTFRNPHGLTHQEQLTTPREMAVLAWRLFHDHRAHYGLFSQTQTTIGDQRLLNTNRRFLSGFQGATGLKTGYTRAAGYNLAGSADRGGVQLLTIVMGAASSPERFERSVALMNWGFSQSTTAVAQRIPPPLGGQALGPVQQGIVEHAPLRSALTAQGGTAMVSDIVSGHSNQPGTTGTSRAPVMALPSVGGFRPILMAQSTLEAYWGVQIGLYPSRYLAEQALLSTTLTHIARLGAAPSSVAQVGTTWSAAYTTMSRRQAESACRHLMDSGHSCAIFSYQNPETQLANQQP